MAMGHYGLRLKRDRFADQYYSIAVNVHDRQGREPDPGLANRLRVLGYFAGAGAAELGAEKFTFGTCRDSSVAAK
jgi:hypothetical protein